MKIIVCRGSTTVALLKQHISHKSGGDLAPPNLLTLLLTLSAGPAHDVGRQDKSPLKKLIFFHNFDDI